MSVVAINPDTFWVADQGKGSILRVFKGMGEITQFRDQEPENFPSIVGSCHTPDGKILFTDSKLNKIFRFVPGNRELQIFNDSISLDQPTGIAYSAVKEEIWVVETKAHRISVFNKNGELLKQIGGRGNGPGEFNFPTYIWIDRSGTIYVVDAMNFRIQIFDRNGDFISAFGEIGDASGYFARPKGVATDSFGHIYVTDVLYHAVQVFDQNGKLLYVFGSRGSEKEQFWMPTGIFIDDRDFIYIADSYNSRIQIFQLALGN
jgi:DNA-binding beta-propeller fold protein YncE